MRAHHQLRVWQAAMVLVREVYAVSAQFPAEERFGLTAQIRRSAVSVPSNIAEGAALASRREFSHFLVIARGSLSELDTQLRIAQDLGFCDAAELIKTIEMLFALLAGLLRAQAATKSGSADSSRAAQPRSDEVAQATDLA